MVKVIQRIPNDESNECWNGCGERYDTDYFNMVDRGRLQKG